MSQRFFRYRPASGDTGLCEAAHCSNAAYWWDAVQDVVLCDFHAMGESMTPCREVCDEMGAMEEFEYVYARVSALTQRVMLEWLVTSFTFSEMIGGYSHEEIATILEELDTYSVLVWTDGLPEVDWQKVKV